MTASSASVPASLAYRRLWRWHFYAGLLCLPLLLSLALTGALYVFHQEIEEFVYGDLLLRAHAADGPAQPPAALIAAAQAHAPGRPLALHLPRDPAHTVQVDVQEPEGVRQVFLDPVSAGVAGSIPERARLMVVVKRLHSMSLAGAAGRVAVELAAGWAIVLVATGLALWWPRGAATRPLWRIRPGARGRSWWRDLHAAVGVYAGLAVLFLALSGMPWSVLWGQQFNRWMGAMGLGVPDGVWKNLPRSDRSHAELGEAPWTLRSAPLPRSIPDDEHAGHRGAAAPASGPGAGAMAPDAVVARLAAVGLTGAYRLTLPRDADGVYTALRSGGPLAETRIVHLDQYSGAILLDVDASRYGAVARVTEWGVSVHQGQEYGLANKWLMFGACLALLVLAVSGAWMWWKRRPPGRIAAPQARPDERLPRPLLAGAALLGMLFPPLGASMLAVALLDRLLSPALRRRYAL